MAENQSKLKQVFAKTFQICPFKHNKGVRKKLVVKNKANRVLLDSGLSEDLLFLKKGASKDIPDVKRAVPQLWGTPNGTFVTDKMGNIKIVFVDCSISKKVHLVPDIVEYNPGLDKSMYDLIIGKSTMQKLGVILEFNFARRDVPAHQWGGMQNKTMCRS